MSLENLRKIFIPELAISLYLYNVSKEVSKLTDIQEIQNYSERVKQHDPEDPET